MFDSTISQMPLINALIIQKEIVIVSMLSKIGVCKFMIPLILLFL
jgi:hypothetical protein